MPKAKKNDVESTAVAKPGLEKKDVVTADQVLKRITGQTEKKGKMANLPLVSAVYQSSNEMNHAIDTLTTAYERDKTIKELSDNDDPTSPGLKQLKDEIIAIAVGAEVPGYRYGSMAVSVDLQSRSSFDKKTLVQFLLDSGVDPTVISEAMKAATKDGDPFYVVKFDRSL